MKNPFDEHYNYVPNYRMAFSLKIRHKGMINMVKKTWLEFKLE